MWHHQVFKRLGGRKKESSHGTEEEERMNCTVLFPFFLLFFFAVNTFATSVLLLLCIWRCPLFTTLRITVRYRSRKTSLLLPPSPCKLAAQCHAKFTRVHCRNMHRNASHVYISKQMLQRAEPVNLGIIDAQRSICIGSRNCF